ncbi:hypothetical protein Pcinc_026435 [Petrolisthes cinctipes]|uniref:Uncharacterized protein n=1 Tax=Petrolisthes cinctipes TaxID=88211 RepID=A0AAE1KA30_PETCI|nr:hypothetical protein Pcinc_026435 [Petrolisthes cinctipes]
MASLKIHHCTSPEEDQHIKSTIERNPRTTSLRIIYDHNLEYDAQYVVSDGRSERIGAGLFGWIHASGVGELVDVGTGRLTGEEYVEILEEVFLPSDRILLYPHPSEFFLVQDNSPIHKCEVVKKWFMGTSRN